VLVDVFVRRKAAIVAPILSVLDGAIVYALGG
jgi:hypothetical protein